MGNASSVLDTEALGADALELQESARLADDRLGRDGRPLPEGTYKIHIIRPGVGRGRGRHLYEADMLRENADVFAGWKMYLNHLSPDARKAAGGLPRAFEHLGGSVKESWWDPSVPADADRGFGQGAVVGVAKPVGLAKQILADDPEIAEVSISAHATGVKPVQRDGERVLLVEGIHPEGSVDWVTQAGAGGRVVGLAEALVEEARLTAPDDLLAWLDDEQIADYVREQRPELAETLGLAAEVAPPATETETETETETDPAPEAEGDPPPEETPEVDEDTPAEEATSAEGDDDMGITPEMLREALADPEVRESLKGLFADEQREQLAEQQRDFEQRAELIRAEARADADRAIQLTRLEAQARAMIDEAKLPDRWAADLRKLYSLDEAGFPATALDVVDEVDDDGNVVKRASEVLRESVEAELQRNRELIADLRPTRVVNQGPAQTPAQRDGDRVEEGDGGEPAKPKGKVEQPYWAEYLQEAGIDPSKSFQTAEAAL